MYNTGIAYHAYAFLISIFLCIACLSHCILFAGSLPPSMNHYGGTLPHSSQYSQQGMGMYHMPPGVSQPSHSPVSTSSYTFPRNSSPHTVHRYGDDMQMQNQQQQQEQSINYPNYNKKPIRSALKGSKLQQQQAEHQLQMQQHQHHMQQQMQHHMALQHRHQLPGQNQMLFKEQLEEKIQQRQRSGDYSSAGEVAKSTPPKVAPKPVLKKKPGGYVVMSDLPISCMFSKNHHHINRL